MQAAGSDGSVRIQSAPSPPRDRIRHTVSERVVLALVLIGLVALYLPTVRWLVGRWSMSVWHHAHGFLIPPIVAYFVYQELRECRHVPASSSALGFLFLVPALALHVLDTGIHTELLSAVSIVLILPGLSLLFLGTKRTVSILFPLAFVAFMLPIPLAFVEPVHMVLRRIAVAGTESLVRLIGLPVLSEGTTLHVPNAALLIGDACSGFSTLYAAVALALLTAYSSNEPKRRALVLLSAAPLAVAANIVRVTLLIVVVYWTGVDVLSTWFHPFTGMLTFALSLPLIFWLGMPRAEPPAEAA